MKQVNKKVLKVVERVMRKEAVYGIDGFPPACLGIWHQPKRPNIKKRKKVIENNVQIVVQNKLRKAGIDMKNKFITTVVATALALTMTFSLANGMDVKAAEITEDSLVAAEDTNVGNESVDIQQQEPVEISELETTENNDLSKSSEVLQ